MTQWCILRCSGQKTLRLAASLAEAGYEVWSPIETKRIRIPRANVRREVTLPIMPSYVFARATHLIDLLQLAGRPAHAYAHADFSVMRHGESIPLVRDDSLQALRRLEAKRTAKKRADRVFGSGVDVQVKIEGGSFAGMKGRVEKSDALYTLVCFDDRLTVRIATCLLDQDQLRNEQPCSWVDTRKAA
jgi:transcription antitermination factor NusG